MRFITGIDPGGTTGVAMIKVTKHKTELHRMWALPYDMFIDELSAGWLIRSMSMVGVEKYDIGVRTIELTRQPEAMYAVGAIDLVCRRVGATMHIQSRADAKNAFTNDILKRLGCWSTSPHIRDATRQALLLARRQGLENTEQLRT